MPDQLPYTVEPMTLADIEQVMEIEQVAFPTPWSARAYRFEITDNEHSIMIVVRPVHRSDGWLSRFVHPFKSARPGPLLGYAGFWLLADDAHICTIAVHPQRRRQGLGELLLLSLLDRAIDLGAHRSTLEVRVSNQAAQGLYAKYGFEIASRRRGYYADTNEDAYIMTTPLFRAPAFQANLRRCRDQLYTRLRKEVPDRPAG